MKTTNKFISKLSLVFLTLMIVSCSEENPIGSDITYYADINPVGSPLTVITQGNTFTDPGATSIINGESVAYTTSGSVNVNTPGVYKLTYETINDDGFAASAVRTVVVLKNTPSIYNLAGSWRRTNNSPVTIVQISDREYTHSNAGGVTGANQLRVTFYNVDDSLLYIPFTTGASESGISVESLSGQVVSNDSFNWSLNASAFYGTFVREFRRL